MGYRAHLCMAQPLPQVGYSIRATVGYSQSFPSTWLCLHLLELPRKEVLLDILRLAGDLGYSPMNQDTGKVTGIGADGLEELKFRTLDEAVAFACANGVGLNLWRKDIEYPYPLIFFTFEPAARMRLLD